MLKAPDTFIRKWSGVEVCRESGEGFQQKQEFCFVWSWEALNQMGKNQHQVDFL